METTGDARIFKPLKFCMFDYLIIGQGLAGSCLAWQLVQRGKKILVLDVPQKNRSSMIAAGLFNPITGKLMTRTWLAETLFQSVFDFYPEAERALNQKFFHPMPLYRPFLSVQEQNEWMGYSAQPENEKFIERIHTRSAYGDQAYDAFGGLVIRQCGYVDVPVFLSSVRVWLVQQNAFAEEWFDESQLQYDNTGVTYKQWQASAVIFCTGVTSQTRLWQALPVKPLKGETLTVQLDEAPKLIYNRGVYIVPSAGNYCKVGATYEAHRLSETITEKARAELEARTAELLRLPFQTVAQDWGMRPTSPDRRPMLGRHPNSKNVVIFNGLGTKGVSLAPYFAAHLADWLAGVAEIMPVVNINRFKALYSKS
ncbi:MAG: FAD-dependent oxidoreductase [Cyclobacteriaceae bacterium]|nr:FAD-dependent oxidoreductase [Cyclobacteriaceae bacterium]